MYYSIKYCIQNFSEISDQAFQKENPDPCFYVKFCGSVSGFFALLKISEHGTHTGGVVVPRMQRHICKFLRFYFFRLRACVTKCWFCHIRLAALLSRRRRMSPPAKQLQGFCGRAVRSAPAAARRFAAARLRRCLCRSAPLRPLHPCRRYGWTA